MVIVLVDIAGMVRLKHLAVLVQLLLLLVAMPFVGLYLLINPNSMSKGLGLLLTVFGVAIWIIVFTMK